VEAFLLGSCSKSKFLTKLLLLCSVGLL